MSHANDLQRQVQVNGKRESERQSSDARRQPVWCVQVQVFNSGARYDASMLKSTTEQETTVELRMAHCVNDKATAMANCRRLRAIAVILLLLGLFNLVWYLVSYRNVTRRHASRYPVPVTVESQPESDLFEVDRKLRQLAESQIDNGRPFIHVNAHPKNAQQVPVGHSMNSAREIAASIEPILQIRHPCGGRQGVNQTVAILLFNIPSDIQRRQVIRETYGSALKRNPQTEIYFVLGRDTHAIDSSIQEQINGESQQYNDILQFNFTESYYNLTLKSIAVLRWTALHCPHVKYVFKLDNDCFVRMNPLLDALNALDGHSILGLYRAHEPVLRNGGTKWDISPLYYPPSHYPPYIAGPYLIPGYAASQLYSAITRHPTTDTIPALPFDDAYITGILAEKANVSRSSWNGIRQLYHESDKANIGNMRQYSVFYEFLGDADLRRLWTLFGEN